MYVIPTMSENTLISGIRQEGGPRAMQTSLYTVAIMPRRKTSESALASAAETPGERLARLRKERGWTQVELAERIGITQTLLSDYERGKLRLNADMIVRFANALDVTTDDLLQPKGARTTLRPKPSLRVQRRMEKIEKLPPHQQNYLLKTIDGFLKGVAS
jgi:transcriptional regulator with XRE-family HTH domain